MRANSEANGCVPQAEIANDNVADGGRDARVTQLYGLRGKIVFKAKDRLQELEYRPARPCCGAQATG